MTPSHLAPIGSQQVAQHPRAGEGKLQMQLVHLPHEGKVGRTHQLWHIVEAPAADVQRFGLLRQWQIMLAVDHRFALSKPALLSALSKKSFSSVNSPILACNDLMSTSGVGDLPFPDVAKTSTDQACSRSFQAVI